MRGAMWMRGEGDHLVPVSSTAAVSEGQLSLSSVVTDNPPASTRAISGDLTQF